MPISVSRLDRSFICVRTSSWEDERLVKQGTYEWSSSEKAFICPRPRIVEIIDTAKKEALEIADFPEDIYRSEKMNKIAFEATLAALRAIRQTGARAEDIDYFRDHFHGKFPPYRHQLVTFQYVSLIDRCAVFNEMGTGKTASVIWAIDWRRIQKLAYTSLVIAPNNILQNWEREIALHAPHLKTVVLQGSRHERLDLLDTLADVYIMNYEGIRVIGDDLKHKFQYVILDEAHKIKDPQASQTKLISEIFDDTVRYKTVMTGTPIGNELLDLHQQMTWLDPFMFEPYHIFKAHHFHAVGGKFKPNHGVQKMIQDKTYMRAVRYKKEECLDLPPKTYIQRTCVMEGAQKTAYQQMLRAFMTAMEDGLINAKNVLSQIMKLSQITSGFIRDEQGVDHIFRKVAKLDLLQSVLEEIGPEKKVVIWARFIPDIKRIGRLLNNGDKEEKAVLLYGATAKGGKALAIADRFRDDPSILYLVGNPAVGGLGLNMTVASYAVYYSNDYSWIKRSQSEDRIHRMGSEAFDQITIIDLVTEKTIDEPVVGSLINKKELARVIIDLYKTGIVDAFGLLKDKKEAEERLVAAATQMAEVNAIIDFTRQEYAGAMEMDEPECSNCHSKSIHPSATEAGVMICDTCGETWE